MNLPWSNAVLNIWMNSQRLGRNTIRKLVTRQSGEEICGQTWLYRIWGDLWPMLMLTKEWHQQRKSLITQKLLFCGYQSLSVPSYCCPSQMNTESGHGSKAGGFAWAQQHKVGSGPAECPTCQETKSETLIWHHSPGSLARHLLVWWLHWWLLFHHGALFSLE